MSNVINHPRLGAGIDSAALREPEAERLEWEVAKAMFAYFMHLLRNTTVIADEDCVPKCSALVATIDILDVNTPCVIELKKVAP